MRKLLPILLLACSAVPAHALSGTLYGLGAFGEIYAIDPSDASTTLLGTVGGVTACSGLAFDPLTGTLVLGDHVGGEILLKSVDLASFTATTLATLDAGFVDSTLRDLAILPDGRIFGFGWTPNSGQRHELYEIDRASGAAVSRLVGLPGGLAVLDADTLLYGGGDASIALPGFVTSVDLDYEGDVTDRGTQMTYAADEDATYFLENCALNAFCPGRPLYRVDRGTRTYERIGPPDVVLKGIAVPEAGRVWLALAAWLGVVTFAAHRRKRGAGRR